MAGVLLERPAEAVPDPQLVLSVAGDTGGVDDQPGHAEATILRPWGPVVVDASR